MLKFESDGVTSALEQAPREKRTGKAKRRNYRNLHKGPFKTLAKY